MGRTRNRKKRRLGRIRKFLANIAPATKVNYSYRQVCGFGYWCGGYKWLDEVYKKYYATFTPQDRYETEMVVTEDGVEYPNYSREGNHERFLRLLRIMKEFDERKIPGKRYHSKKIARLRQRFIKHEIRIRESCVRGEDEQK